MMVYQGKPDFRASVSLFFRCFSYIRHKGVFVIGFLMASTEHLIAFATPLLYQIIMAVISDSSQVGQEQTKLPLLLAGITLLIPVCTYGRYLQVKCSAQGSAELNKAMFDHIQRMPLSIVSQNGMDVYLTRLNMDADAAVNVFRSYGLTAFAKFIVIGGGSLLVLLFYSWQMALLGLCVGGSCAFLALLWTPKLRQMEWEAKEANSLSLASLIEILQGFRIVRIFNLKEILQKKYNMICEVIYDKRVKFCTFRGIMYGILVVCSYIAQPLAMLIGIWVLLFRGIDITEIILISSYVALVGTSTRHFTNFALHLPKSLVAAERVFAIMDQKIETQIEDSCLVDLFCPNSIRVSNLCFSYLPNQPVLEDISFSIKKGEHVAIVGESGCGKSTLMKLIQRLIDPDSGDITAFSASYRNMSLETTRSLISYIPQECNLFFGTIADNIAFGKENATMAEIIESARKANIHQFVESLPEGYNTLVGERGYALSGGQRQRIVIARALIKDAPILLMDEPTSSLDIENEEVIFQEVLSTARDKTIIAITHRMSIAEYMDRIFLIKDKSWGEIDKT